jgi:polar amino acid transport system substrate-binding protein
MRFLVLLSCVALAMGADPAHEVAPGGTLRVTFLGANPTQGKVDAATGAVSGPVKELADALAKKLGIPVTIKPLSGVPAVLESLKTHQADIGFLAADPSRAGEADFSQAYLLGWSSYIVPVASGFRSVKDVDRAGVRVAALPNDSPGLYLQRNLKNAAFVAVKTQEEGVGMLASGEVQAYGANRARELQMVAADPRFRVLDDNYSAVQQAVAVPKGSAAALEIVNQFLDEAKASGLIEGAIRRGGLAGAADIAPARK